MTRLAVGCPTLAVSPQNGTKSDLRRSEIKKFPGGTCPPRATPISVHASRALCDQSRAQWNPPFQNPRSATELHGQGQSAHKIDKKCCTKLLPLPDNANFSPSAKMKICTLSQAPPTV